jgi:hypothetical protein
MSQLRELGELVGFGWQVSGHTQDSGQEVSLMKAASVGRVILDWTRTRGWACTTIVRNALCAWANTNGRMGAPVGRVIKPGEVAGQEDGTSAVVMDYVGRARTVKVSPVDRAQVSVVTNVWVHGTASQRKVPRSSGTECCRFDRQSICVWAYGKQCDWLCSGTRICLGR